MDVGPDLKRSMNAIVFIVQNDNFTVKIDWQCSAW